MRPQISPANSMYMSGAGMARAMGPGPSYLPRHRSPSVNMVDSMGLGPGRGPETMMTMNMTRGPESMGLGPGRGAESLAMGRQEWRQVVMSQQQSAAFSAHGRTFTNHPGMYYLRWEETVTECCKHRVRSLTFITIIIVLSTQNNKPTENVISLKNDYF